MEPAGIGVPPAEALALKAMVSPARYVLPSAGCSMVTSGGLLPTVIRTVAVPVANGDVSSVTVSLASYTPDCV